jgi:hypothetical protein
MKHKEAIEERETEESKFTKQELKNDEIIARDKRVDKLLLESRKPKEIPKDNPLVKDKDK